MEEKHTIELRGRLVSGKEEGQYFLSKEGYREQFIDKLGIDPYEGTLNVKLDEHSVEKFNKIRNKTGIVIEGFVEGEQNFGNVKAYKAEINGVRSALVIPKKSDYKRTAEFISNTNFRKEMGLKDGDVIEATVWV